MEQIADVEHLTAARKIIRDHYELLGLNGEDSRDFRYTLDMIFDRLHIILTPRD